MLAQTRPIQGTDWALVVKVDEIEALAEHRASARSASLGVLGLLAALLSVGFVLWRGERVAYDVRLGAYRAQLASLLDHANDAILFVRRDGRIFHANGRAEKLYGYTIDELMGMRLYELRADRDDRAFEAMAETIVRQGALVFESIHRRRDGTTVEVEVSSSALDREGEQVFLSLVRDVTERKAAEARYQSLVESVQAIVWRADAHSFQFTFVSPQAESLLGYPARRWIDEPGFWSAHMHPDDRDWAVSYCAKATAEKRDPVFEYRMVGAEGRVVWLRNVVRVVVVDGEARELVGAMFDVTERYRVEAIRSGERQVLEMIASGAPLPETLEALVPVVEEQGDGALGSVMLLADGRLSHGAAPSLPPPFCRAIDGEEIGPSCGSCGTSAWRRQTVVVTDIATDPLWAGFRDLALGCGLRACWSVPIMARDGSVLGTFAFYHREPRGPTSEQLDLIERASHVAAIAITRQRSETALRELSGHVERVREDERTMIAREIHDELGQSLTALKMDISWLGRRLGSQLEPRPDLLARLERMSRATDSTIDEMRRIAANLRPGVLDELGLRAAVEWQSREFEQRTSITCTVLGNLGEERLDPELSTGVFRILQEALTNIARHAGAQRAEVRLGQDGQGFTLKVQDDGRGLSAQEASRPGRFGLLGMRERARRLGGTLEVIGRPGGGTEVVLSLPGHGRAERVVEA